LPTAAGRMPLATRLLSPFSRKPGTSSAETIGRRRSPGLAEQILGQVAMAGAKLDESAFQASKR
jgi:hypothetical protein